MKKIVSLIAFTFIGILLMSCTPEEDPYVVDCTKFPTHEDCEVTDPVTCDEGYILDGDNCILDTTPVTCADDYILVDDTCVFDDSSVGDYLDIYYLNDFHGGLLQTNDQIGISYIANLINSRKEESPDNVLFLAGGDMLQGSALSNYFEGLSTINILNAMNLDAFTIGNHEFDWGIETIMQYADGNAENGEADFPFLGANVFYDGTENIVEGMDPYTIVEKGNKKIGIIGTMGFGLEYSIAQSRIDGYEFGDPMTQIEFYSSYLRETENCDIIIVVAHDSGSYINNQISQLTGSAKVDIVFNGHSHNEYARYEGDIPVIQSGSSGEAVGHARILFDETGIESYDIENIGKYGDQLLQQEDPTVKSILEAYQLETDPLFNDPIITSDAYYSSYDLTTWIAELMRVSTNADIGIHNYGGTRTDLDDGEVINLGKLYEIWPFDNVIKTVELKGSVVTNLLSGSGTDYSTNITYFEPNTYYTVATNDYLFDKTGSAYQNGLNPTNTGLVLRDVAQSELLLQAELYSSFRTDNTILTTLVPVPAPATYTQKEEE